MAEPTQDRIDELGDQIDQVRREAQEHGTIPDEEPTLADPDGDGEEEPFTAQPPG